MPQMTKAQARDVLANAKTVSVQIGDTIQVYVGDSDDLTATMDKDISKGLKAGKMIQRDGTKQWINDSPITNTSKSGSGAYTWDKGGNKIKHNRTLVTMDADGNKTDKIIGTVFKNF